LGLMRRVGPRSNPNRGSARVSGRAGLAPRDLAKQVRVSESPVMRRLAGRTVDTAVLEKLCALLGLSFLEL
jgi:hypothetical protein